MFKKLLNILSVVYDRLEKIKNTGLLMAWVENKQQFSTKLCFLTFRPILSERRLN
jgi:hypothetical protein